MAGFSTMNLLACLAFQLSSVPEPFLQATAVKRIKRFDSEEFSFPTSFFRLRKPAKPSQWRIRPSELLWKHIQMAIFSTGNQL